MQIRRLLEVVLSTRLLQPFGSVSFHNLDLNVVILYCMLSTLLLVMYGMSCQHPNSKAEREYPLNLRVL